MNSKIMVSISCTTYNHEQYIRKCLDGFLMQKCDFGFEVLIHDDASSDTTQSIIKEYQEKYPDIIKPYLQSVNQWSQGVRGMNAKYNFSRAKGKYIAMCEGDDYWIDPLKLQKQVDFLEENPDYGLVSTNADNTPRGLKNKDITPFEILHENPIRTLTTLFIRSKIKDFTPKDRVMGDIQLWLHLVKKARVFFMKDNTAYYRVLQDSASGRNDINKRIDFIKDRILVTKDYINFFSLSTKEKKKILQDQYSGLIMISLKKSKKLAFKFYLESLWSSKMLNSLDIKILKNFW